MPPKNNVKLEKIYFRKKTDSKIKRFFQWLFRKNKWQEIKIKPLNICPCQYCMRFDSDYNCYVNCNLYNNWLESECEEDG